MSIDQKSYDMMSINEKQEILMGEVSPRISFPYWITIMILILASKFDGLCLFSPNIINEDRKFIHHSSMPETFVEYRKKQYRKLFGKGKTSFSHEIDDSAMIWSVTERINKDKRTLNGTLLLPKILLDSYHNFYEQIKRCLDTKFTRKLENKKLPPPKWRKIQMRRVNPDSEEYDEHEYYKYVLGVNDEIQDGEDVKEDDEEDDDYEGDEDNKSDSKVDEIDTDEDDEDYIPPSDEERIKEKRLDRLYDKISLAKEVDESPPEFTPIGYYQIIKRFFTGNEGPRYIIMPLAVNFIRKRYSKIKSTSHAEVLVFDRKRALIQHFDPNGYTPDHLVEEMLEQIRLAFNEFYENLVYSEAKGLKLTVRSAHQICPIGPQLKLEPGKGQEAKKILDSLIDECRNQEDIKSVMKSYSYILDNSCTVWSFMYMYLSLYYPNVDSEKIIEIMSKPDPGELEDILIKVTIELALITSEYIDIYSSSYAEVIQILSSGVLNHLLQIQDLFEKPE